MPRGEISYRKGSDDTPDFWLLGVVLEKGVVLRQYRCGDRKFKCGAKEINATKGRRKLLNNAKEDEYT